MKKIILVTCLLTACVLVSKGETILLNLDETIDIALGKSYTVLTNEQDIQIAAFNLKYATNRLRTNVNLTLTAPRYTESVETKEDSVGIYFYTVKRLDYSGLLSVNQPLPTDGNIYVETGLANYEDYHNRIRSSNMNARLRFNQPLDAFYGYNSIKSELKRAKLNFEKSASNYKRDELKLIVDVTSAYYNVLSEQKSVEIAQMNLERQKDAYEISKNKYEAGLLREVDALQMEVDLAQVQNNYDESIVRLLSAKNYLKQLIGLNLNLDIEVDDRLSYDVLIIDSEEAVRIALENRLEIRESDIDIEIQELEIKRQKAAGMVKGNIDAYYQKTGISQENRDFSIWETINNAYDDLIDRPSNYGVGLTITLPVFDWGVNRSLVRAAQARQIKNKLAKDYLLVSIEREVRDGVARVNSYLKSLKLFEKSVEIAERSFEITLQRYSDGDIDSQALALERDRLNSAYISHLRAYIDYQSGISDLMRLTFYDFRNKRVID